MRKNEFLQVLQSAGLSQMDRAWAPASTVVLHACLQRHGVECDLVFRRVAMEQRVANGWGEASWVHVSATVAGIVVDGKPFNARGHDPVQDAPLINEKVLPYSRWAKDPDLGYLTAHNISVARDCFGSLIDGAVCQWVLANTTPIACGGTGLVRL